MYDYNDMAMMWGVIAMFYIGFFVIYWILVGIISDILYLVYIVLPLNRASFRLSSTMETMRCTSSGR